MAQALMNNKGGMPEAGDANVPGTEPSQPAVPAAPVGMKFNMSNLADKVAAMRQNGGIFGVPEGLPAAKALPAMPSPQGLPPAQGVGHIFGGIGNAISGIGHKLGFGHKAIKALPAAPALKGLPQIPGQAEPTPVDVSRIQQALQQMFAANQNMRVPEPMDAVAPTMPEPKPVDGSY